MRPIDADALYIVAVIGGNDELIKTVKSMIDNAPTLDVAPVVRCKDCKAWDVEKQNGKGGCFCWCSDNFTGMMDFCSFGARRDDGSNTGV